MGYLILGWPNIGTVPIFTFFNKDTALSLHSVSLHEILNILSLKGKMSVYDMGTSKYYVSTFGAGNRYSIELNLLTLFYPGGGGR